MPNEPRERRYTKAEVRDILRRAAEMQAREGRAETSAAGPTLEQLQQAAAEAGLDPALIAAAARGLPAARRQGWWERLWGGPWSADDEVVLDGAVTADDWPGLLDEIRAETGRTGSPEQVGSGFEWSSPSPDTMHVSVTPHGGRTRVRVSSRFSSWATLFVALPAYIATIAGAITGALLGSKVDGFPALLAFAIGFGLPSAALLIGRTAFARLCARRRGVTHALAARIEGWFADRPRAEDTVAGRAPVPALAEEQPQPLEARTSAE